MKKFLIASVVVAAAVVLVAVQAKATTVAQWTFESFATSTVNTSGPLSPEVGSGTATGVHSGTTTFSEPGGDVDPTIAAMDPGASAAGAASSIRSWSANGWSVNDYWQFKVSTLTLDTIRVGWDQTGSNTGPKFFQLQYSTDGSSFITVGAVYTLPVSGWNTTTVSPLSTIVSEPGTAWDNQATLYFRLYDTSTTSINGATVASTGTDRVDNFTVVGIPEPSTVALVGAGLVGLFAIRRRRS
jgi:hypothetical protein